MCQGNMDSIFDVPTNLSALLEELIQRWQAASSQFQGPIFNAIEGADKEVEAYLQEIQRDLQGAHITALSSFYAGADLAILGSLLTFQTSISSSLRSLGQW